MPSESNQDPRVCRRILYSGRVQGVGFRYTTARIARGCDVRGYVRNLPDGTVEIVVAGASATVDEFAEAVAGTFEGYITGSRSAEMAPAEEFSRFEIRH